MIINTYNLDLPQDAADLEKLRRRLRDGQLVSSVTDATDVPDTVRRIIADVQDRQDEALVELTERFDGVKVGSIAVEPDTIAAAAKTVDADFLALLRRAIKNIREYQQSILTPDPPALVRAGRKLGVRYTPVDRVGVYVPGGRAFYPSTVLMTVVPALVAGVKQIAIASPPTSNGDVHPMVLALASELGIEEVYRVGGAQAICALAVGTQTIPAVDKIVGPGNAFVAEAKRQLFGQVGIDSIAGPSEVLIIADDTARADYVAADLMAQAEHDPGAAVLVTTSRDLATQVNDELERQLDSLSRCDAIAASLEANCCIAIVSSLPAAAEVANRFATEHLQIITKDDDGVMKLIRHAGAIFMGQYTPVPLGDYYAGPSHVLPTGSTARFFSALSCNDFRKASSVIEYDATSLDADADDVASFATQEGLTAHANAVRIRGGSD